MTKHKEGKTMSLAEFVTQKMLEERLSSYDIERRSHKAISQSNVNRISRGEIVNPAPDTIKALAAGLGVPLETLRNLIYDDGPAETDSLTITAIVDYLGELPPETQDDVLQIVKTLHRKYTR
jgi:transcriptional regulator with XRE-family HTH domain